MEAYDFKPFGSNGGSGSGGGRKGGWSEAEAIAWEKGYRDAERGMAPNLSQIPDHCRTAYKTGWEAGRK